MTERSVLITGCASGIGLDAARALSTRGWRVLATCRRAEDCVRLEAEGLESFALDCADPESVAAGAAEALARTDGRLGALFNNGAFALPGPLEDIPREALAAVFEANVLGPHDLIRRLLPSMRSQGRGRIVNCSSVLGFLSLRHRGAYSASKFALEALSDALRRELEGPEAPGGADIRVILIEPGPIRTPFRAKSLARVREMLDPGASAWREAWDAKILPRLEAEDPERLARFERTPAAVTAKLVHALESPRPRARYYVTPATWIAAGLARALPTRWLDRAFGGDF